MATLTFDRRQFARLASELGRVKKLTVQETLKELGGTLLRYLLSLTPPFGKHPIQENGLLQKKIGEAAVKRDFAKAFQPFSPEGLKRFTPKINPRAARYLRMYARKGLIGKIKTMLRGLGVPESINIIPRVTTELARQNVNLNVRPHKIKQRFMVLRAESIARERTRTVARVGRAKAGWLRAILGHMHKLPAWVPAWVRRHGPQAGGYTDRSFAAFNPYIEFVNLTDGALTEDVRQVEVAYGVLQITMRKQVEAILAKRARQFNSRR